MMCLVTVRQIKPGTYEDFRKAWLPDPWPPQLHKAQIMRNDDNPDEIVTLGFVDATPDELDAMRDDPEILESEAKRLERMAPYEERLLVNGIFEVVEELTG